MKRLIAPWLLLANVVAASDVHDKIRIAVQSVIDEMAQKHNTSFSFGFVDSSGDVALAGGVNNVWTGAALTNETLIPLGSVTKPWTALQVMKHVEAGRLHLDDLASRWVDPVFQRLFQPEVRKFPHAGITNASLEGLWGPQAADIQVGDLLGMTSGLADYNDSMIMNWTLHHGGDDMPPFAYLVSASRQGMLCKPRTCASYSGTNYVLLGLVLVELEGVWTWQDVNQLDVVPRHLWHSGRYRHTTFPKLGRCSQTTGIAHQYAAYQDVRYKLPHIYYNDLERDSCLNGWTMGNIASTGGDLAKFFYDVFTLAPTGNGFVNETTLKTMTQYKKLQDTWCPGPRGPGSCQYGMGFFKDQVGQDVFRLANPRDNREDVRLQGHPGQDWGSSCTTCGYNPKFGFGVCVAVTSAIGMNCSNPARANSMMTYEASCHMYDAVLSVVGGPRLACPSEKPVGVKLQCDWGNTTPQALPPDRRPLSRWSPDVALEQRAEESGDVVVI